LITQRIYYSIIIFTDSASADSAVCPNRLSRITEWQHSCCLAELTSILPLSSWFLSWSISAKIGVSS